MAALFTIVSPQRTVEPDAAGHAEAKFIVTNVSGAPIRARARPVPMDEMPPGWLRLVGPPERDLAPEVPTEVLLSIDLPPASPAGSFRFRLDVASIARPDVDYVQSLPVILLVPGEPPKPEPKRPIPKVVVIVPIVAVAVLVLVAVGIGVFVATRPDPMVTLPDVSGQPEPLARTELRALCEPRPCLQVGQRTVRSNLPDGFVVGTQPPAGTTVRRGSVVTLLVAECPTSPFPCPIFP
jgi:hypothetical protein